MSPADRAVRSLRALEGPIGNSTGRNGLTAVAGWGSMPWTWSGSAASSTVAGPGRPAVHRRRAGLRPGRRGPGAPPGHPLRRQGGDHEGPRCGPRRLPLRRRRGGPPGAGRPVPVLHGAAAPSARRAGVVRWHLSLTHTDVVAMALVVAEGGGGRPGSERGPRPRAARRGRSVERHATGPHRRRDERGRRRRPASTPLDVLVAPGRPRRGPGRRGHAGRRLRPAGGGHRRTGQQRRRRPGGGLGSCAAGAPGSAGRGRHREAIGPADLVIDAAYGTGFRGEYRALPAPGARCWPSTSPRGSRATPGPRPAPDRAPGRTVTFVAIKPGLVQGDGARLAGRCRWPTSASRPAAGHLGHGGRRRRRPACPGVGTAATSGPPPCWWWPAPPG